MDYEQLNMDLFKSFREHMDEKSKQAKEDFGMPEVYFEGSEVKHWKFTAEVVNDIPDIVFFNPTLVFAGTQLVGSANVLPVGDNEFEAHCTLDYNIPQRLDAEVTGKPPKLRVERMKANTVEPMVWYPMVLVMGQ
jgi:hypothetical protein